MDSIIAREDNRAGSYYDAAYLYYRMKDRNNALRCLEKALELGYMRFAHIEQDFDMNFIRDTDKYNTIIQKNKSKHEADVSLFVVEATFMMKNGYLNANDVVGSQSFVDANGDVSVGTVINLKNVKFGGLTLTNVRALVVRNQKAPLLLGQSVLGRLGKLEIDNSSQILNISHQTF